MMDNRSDFRSFSLENRPADASIKQKMPSKNGKSKGQPNQAQKQPAAPTGNSSRKAVSGFQLINAREAERDPPERTWNKNATDPTTGKTIHGKKLLKIVHKQMQAELAENPTNRESNENVTGNADNQFAELKPTVSEKNPKEEKNNAK